ncbi:MAG: Flp pilus assembly complex ATPase component TadA [Candidatus Omnitrophica bacterium]|nr:Flp pilus assembly complex ATPase component TadA [Candidatus Omnitrophota bacterium]
MIQLGQILLNKKKISRPQLEHALNIQKRTGEKLGRILSKYHFISEDDLVEALSEQINVPIWDKPVSNIEHTLIEKIGLIQAQHKGILPIVNDSGTPAILLEDPTNTLTISFLVQHGLLYPRFIASPSLIKKNLEELVPISDRISHLNSIVHEIEHFGISGNKMKEFLHSIIEEAIITNASDIHIEPNVLTSDVRFRIDGMLTPIVSLPYHSHENLLNVVYSLASITQSEFSKFHDANFSFSYQNRTIDIRVSSIPTTKYGASIVLRLLDRYKTIMPLKYLGYRKHQIDIIQRLTFKPQGLFLFTGPTGSGKTTSLYSILSMLRTEEVKILTIEDPVEVELPLTQQVEVNEPAEITFSSALRAFLRHDPDIVLVGEIRDKETAVEAIRASLTGHKTFSTLHTQDTFTSITRLLDLDISLSYLGMSIEGIISQRLIRKLCPLCKKEISVSQSYSEKIKAKTIYQPVGCNYCNNGYKGRTVAVEILEVKGNLKEVMKEGNYKKIKEEITEIQNNGFISLLQDGYYLIEQGITSIEEIERVVGSEN